MKRSDGFTLMELMAAMAVMCILVAVIVPAGISWLRGYEFSSMTRTMTHAVLAARMQAMENKAIYKLNSVNLVGNNLRFSTLLANELAAEPDLIVRERKRLSMRHQFRRRNPAIPNPPPAGSIYTPGDFVMFSGLDHACNMNGAEFEVLATPDEWTFEVQANPLMPAPSLAGSITTPTVRNLTAPGRLRIIAANNKYFPNAANENEASFSSSGYQMTQEGSSTVFKFDVAKYLLYFDDPAFPNPPGIAAMDPAGNSSETTAGLPPPYRFHEVRFDSRGLPENLIRHSVRVTDNAKGGRQPQQALYRITPTGNVVSPGNE